MRMFICHIVAFFLAFAVSSASGSNTQFIDAQIRGASVGIWVMVVDEAGCAVQGADVSCRLGMVEECRSVTIHEETDVSGRAWIEGRTGGNYLDLTISHIGYYSSSRRLCFVRMGQEREVKNGRWQPWGAVEKFVLRTKGECPNLLRFSGSFDIPMTNQWCGFDLKLGDWVSPMGKGTFADFEVNLDWDGLPPPRSSLARITIRFTGENSGFYSVTKSVESELRGVHRAESDSKFRKELICSRIRENGIVQRTGIGKLEVLVCRSRCLCDNKGVLVSANYAQIEGLWVDAGWNGHAKLGLKSSFNPKVNDISLECAW